MARRDPRQAHLTDLLPSGPKIVRMYAIPMQRLAIITPIKLRILVEALTIYVRLSEGPKDQFSALAIHVMEKVHPRSLNLSSNYKIVSNHKTGYPASPN